MNRSKGSTIVLLAIPEDDLTLITLGALQDAARRIDRGCPASSDASTMKLCREIIRAVVQGKADRHETTLAMIANTMAPAAA